MTFHQWRDARTVYGLNFRTPDDANTFAGGMEAAISHLSSGNISYTVVVLKWRYVMFLRTPQALLTHTVLFFCESLST